MLIYIIYKYNRILLNLKNERNSDIFTTWMNLEELILCEINQSQQIM